MRSMWHHQKLPSKGFGAQYKGSPLTFRSSLDSCQLPYSSRSQHRSTARILRFLSLIPSVVALDLQKLPATVWAAFIRQFLVLRASPLQYQALINALRLECIDLPESIGRGAIKVVPDKVYFLVT